MSTAGDQATDKLIDERLIFLMELFEQYPIHKVRDLFNNVTGYQMGVSHATELYQKWYVNRRETNHRKLQYLKNTEAWKTMGQGLRKKCAEDLSDFILEHFNRTANYDTTEKEK